MMPETIVAKNGPQPSGAYSQAIRFGGYVFTSQFGPMDPVTGKLVAPGDMVAQTRAAIQNLRVILESAGSSLEKVIKVVAYIDVTQWQAFNDTYAEYFPAGALPVRSIVEKPENSEMLVALDAIAYV